MISKISNYYKSGLSLVGVVVASFCFMVAIIPILSIFSLSVENSNTMFARTITYTCAQELVDQLQSIPADALPKKKTYILPNASGTFMLNANDNRTELILSYLPKNYERKLTIKRNTATDLGLIEASLTTFSKLKANITLKATWHSQMIGREK